MRVLLLTTDVFGGHGGIALYNRDLSAALTQHDSVAELVVVPRTAPRGSFELPPRVTFHAEAGAGALAYTRTIAGLKKQRFDLVICGHINLLPVAAVFGRPLLFVYGIDAWHPPHRPLARRLMSRCRGVVSISAITRDRMLAWSGYDGRTFLLPNAIHAGDYGIRPRRRDLIDRYGLAGKRVLLTAGRLDARERYKGFDEVMEILPGLPADVAYLIAGAGSDADRLRERAVSLGVADRVRFTGLFDEAEKADLYSLADAYVMPSRGEGFGFVVLEALAAGVPVVASKHDGTREAVRDGQLGLLVDPANPAEITAAIREVLERPVRGIDPGLEYFSFENFARRTGEIIDAIAPSTRER